MSSRTRSPRAGAEDGFTMIIAIGVMFVTSLLLVAAFTVANGEIQLSHDATSSKQAYYAALSGIQQYEYKLQSNADFWRRAKGLKARFPQKKNLKKSSATSSRP